jgi:lambda family phage minor tail protein L
MTLPISELQKLSQDSPLVEIIGIDASSKGGQFYYITNEAPFPGTSGLTFKGNPVISLPMKTEGWEETTDKTMPKPTITVSNVNKEFFGAVQSFGDLTFMPVWRWLIFARNLDQGSAPDTSKASNPEYYLIERMTKLSDLEISWQLMVPFELPNLKLPLRRVLRDGGFPGAGKLVNQ